MNAFKDRKTVAAVGTAVVVSGLLVSTLIMRTSSAAFSATDIHGGNSFASGVVALSDTLGTGTAVFDSTVQGVLDGGQKIVRCVTVTLNNTLAASNKREIRLSVNGVSTGLAPAADLSTFLNLKVETADLGSTPVAADCTGFDALASTVQSGTADTLASAGAAATTTGAHSDYATGYAGWTGTAGTVSTVSTVSTVYRISTTVQDTNLAQNRSATATFVWEAR